MKKYILQAIILLYTFATTLEAANQADAKTILSPNAASLGLYGEVPVSPFTGSPSINIPIYDIKIGEFKMPISLNYHPSGIKPNDQPSWVGLGWSLISGGVISRIVNFYSDDRDFEDINFARKKGYYYNYSLLNTPTWNTYDYLYSVADNVGNDIFDLAPDKFQFNFLDYNGYFYLSPTGEWQVQCNKKVKVYFDVPVKTVSIYNEKYMNTTINTNVKSFYKFTIIAEDGTQYIFGGTDTSIEYSTDFASQHNTKWIGNSWYLTEVILPNSEKISLEYERGPFIDYMYYTITQDLRYQYDKSSNDTLFIQRDTKELYNYNGQLISPVYLSKIKYDLGEIIFSRKLSSEIKYGEFAYEGLRTILKGEFARLLKPKGGDAGTPISEFLKMLKWYALDNILIKSNENDALKIVNFEYDYSPRLFLKTITERNGNITGKKYAFEYYNIELMPEYLTKKIDHWGFYNGKDFEIDSIKHYSSREPNPDFMKCSIISKIIYPTGGYTKFEFEPHSYRKYVSSDRTECTEMGYNKCAGGSRISQIINSPDGTEQSEFIAKKYFYTSDFIQNKNASILSSGVISGLPRYYSDYSVDVTQNTTIRQKLYSSTSVIPLSATTSGSHIGYSEVYEQYPDNSFTRYMYTNFDNGHLDKNADMVIIPSRKAYSPFSSKEQERGLPTLISNYDNNRNIMSSKIIEYEKDDSLINYVPCIQTKRIAMMLYESIREGTSYRFYTYSMRKKKETVSVYETGSNLPKTSTIKYKYNTDKLLSEIKRSANNNDTYITTFKYPLDYSGYVYTRMKSAHRLNNIIEQSETFQKAGETTLIPLSALQFKYDKSILSPDECYISVKGSDFRQKAAYEYDFKNNLVYLTEDMTTNTVYLWGYNYQYIVAKINNASLQDVKGIIWNINDFASKPVPDFRKLDKLRQLLTKAQVYTYAYKPLVGMIYKTDPNGNTTYYEYDALGRLICIKDLYGNILETYKYNYSPR